MAYRQCGEQQTATFFVARADLLVLPVLYTPSKNTFNYILKSGINFSLAGSFL